MASRRRKKSAEYSDHDRPQNPFAQPGFIASALVLLFVLGTGFFLAFAGGGGKSHGREDSGGVSPGAPAEDPPASVPAVPQDVCPPVRSDDVERPAEAPDDVSWELFQTLALPWSVSAGPMVVEGDVARCYARTPTGALIAAVQIDARYFLARDWRTVVQKQVEPGVGARTYTSRRDADEADFGPASPPVPGSLMQIAGFRVTGYDERTAVVELVRRSNSSGFLKVTELTVVWTDGDWKLQLKTDGADSVPARAVDSLEGFTPWGGV